jgi:hypothetical protein
LHCVDWIFVYLITLLQLYAFKCQMIGIFWNKKWKFNILGFVYGNNILIQKSQQDYYFPPIVSFKIFHILHYVDWIFVYLITLLHLYAFKCQMIRIFWNMKWKFNIHGSVYPNIILIQKSQQDAHVTEFILSDDCSTCFGYHYHPSSGAQNNCNYRIW